MQFLFSTVIYLLIFGLSILLIHQAAKYDSMNKRALSSFALLLSVIILCLVAAYRSTDVGTDTKIYYWAYQRAKMLSFSSYIKEMGVKYELGFMLVVYWATKFLAVYPIARLAIKNSNIYSATLFFACYLFMFYNMTFNPIRQMIAASLVLSAFFLLEDNHKISGIVILLLACFFHKSAVVGVLLTMISRTIGNLRSITSKLLIYGIVPFVIVLLLLNTNGIMRILVSHNVLSSSSWFISTFNDSLSSNFTGIGGYDIVYLIIKLMFLAVPLITHTYDISKNTNRDNSVNYIFVFSTVAYAAIYIVFRTMYAYRITIIGEFFVIPYLSISDKRPAWVRIKKNVFPLKDFLVTMLLPITWFVLYMCFNYQGTNNLSFIQLLR